MTRESPRGIPERDCLAFLAAWQRGEENYWIHDPWEGTTKRKAMVSLTGSRWISVVLWIWLTERRLFLMKSVAHLPPPGPISRLIAVLYNNSKGNMTISNTRIKQNSPCHVMAFTLSQRSQSEIRYFSSWDSISLVRISTHCLLPHRKVEKRTSLPPPHFYITEFFSPSLNSAPLSFLHCLPLSLRKFLLVSAHSILKTRF